MELCHNEVKIVLKYTVGTPECPASGKGEPYLALRAQELRVKAIKQRVCALSGGKERLGGTSGSARCQADQAKRGKFNSLRTNTIILAKPGVKRLRQQTDVKPVQGKEESMRILMALFKLLTERFPCLRLRRGTAGALLALR